MKQDAKNKLIFVAGSIFGLVVLGALVQVVGAQYQWAPPNETFPNANTAPPIDISAAGQKKTGNISIEVGSGLSAVTVSNNTYVGTLNSRIIFGAGPGQNTMIMYGEGVTLPHGTAALSNTDEGMIRYNVGGKKVQFNDGAGWKDVGTGSGSVVPPLVLETNSGGKGVILKRASGDTSGTNSPMIIFSGFGNAQVSIFSDKSIASNFFDGLIEKANATVPACDPERFTCGGGGGGGGGTGYTDPLTQPVWWMRQEGTQFVIKASDPSFYDVRDVLTLTKGGTIVGHDMDLANPKWSATTGEFSINGSKSTLSMDNYVEGWATCPEGYFVSAFRFGRDGSSDLIPTLRCSKL